MTDLVKRARDVRWPSGLMEDTASELICRIEQLEKDYDAVVAENCNLATDNNAVQSYKGRIEQLEAQLYEVKVASLSKENEDADRIERLEAENKRLADKYALIALEELKKLKP